MRLTPQREAEIKRWIQATDTDHSEQTMRIFSELLSEIDALRAELQTSLTITEGAIRISKRDTKEVTDCRVRLRLIRNKLAFAPHGGTPLEKELLHIASNSVYSERLENI